eukprot:5257446-Amphidinium_carterae.2
MQHECLVGVCCPLDDISLASRNKWLGHESIATFVTTALPPEHRVCLSYYRKPTVVTPSWFG